MSPPDPQTSPRKGEGGASPAYDFRRCKLCGRKAGAPLYALTAGTVYGCTDCDFHYIDVLDDLSPERPGGSAELDPRSWERIEAHLRENAPRASRRLNLIRRFASPAKAQCLDIGAGAGDFPALLSAEGASVCGLEPSRLRREFARRRFGIDLLPRTIEELSGDEAFAGRFDIVTLWDVIEHVNFPAETLSAVARSLKPGGVLFLDTPSRDALAYRLSESAYRLSAGRAPLFLSNFYSSLPFGHKQIFRPRQLASLAQRCGLQVLNVSAGYDADPGPAPLLRPRNHIIAVCRRPR